MTTDIRRNTLRVCALHARCQVLFRSNGFASVAHEMAGILVPGRELFAFAASRFRRL